MNALPIRVLLDDKDNHLGLRLLRGRRGLLKKITIPRIQKPGLALTGHMASLHPGRIQVLGTLEINYLRDLSPKQLQKALHQLGKAQLSCIVVTHGNKPPAFLMKETERWAVPLLETNLPTSTFVTRVTTYLEEKLTESTSLHAGLVDVFGVGILLMGKSGIGKSECALELVMKGHRLVADDIVHIKKKAPNSLYGFASELTKYHMEIRGLGIINIKDLFGVASVRDLKLIEVAIQLIAWKSKEEEYDRLGIDEQTYECLGVKIPLLRLPVSPGRSLTSVIEVAARNQLLKLKGVFSAREFQAKLTKEIMMSESQAGRAVFRHFIE
ncbi:MAG: HPr(Ser) kinase/phosphatase [Deltaproteobacteria bacterium]|nr:HPr(Ser) kinase/phosphatase [Deltaproteobacteria bacterium]